MNNVSNVDNFVKIYIIIFNWYERDLFSQFVDIRAQPKGRIMKLFRAKYDGLFEAYKKKKEEEGQKLSADEKNMKFDNSWIKI